MIYELVPSRMLPTLDLSVAVKSRFLSPAAEASFDRWCHRHGHRVELGYLLTSFMHGAVMRSPVHVAQVLAVIGTITGFPASVVSIASLRYSVFTLLAVKYDSLFLMAISWVAMGGLAAMLDDSRGSFMILSAVALTVNVMMDANIHGVRRLAIVNCFGVPSFIFVYICKMFDLTPRLHDFVLFTFKSQQLRMKSITLDAMLSLIATVARNVYRSRGALLKRTKGVVVECVSYRCQLQIVRSTVLNIDAISGSQIHNRPAHIQDMRYVPSVSRIDTYRVIAPAFFPSTPTLLSRYIMHSMRGITYFLMLALPAHIVFESADFFSPWIDNHVVHSSLKESYRLVYVAITLVYCSVCMAHYQRELWLEICTSFDFIFLSFHSIFIHVAFADFFRWQPRCVLLVVSLCWTNWVLCFYALTPVVRDQLGLKLRHAKLVFSIVVCSLGVAIYLVVFGDTADAIYNRVLWSGYIFENHVEMRLLSPFYSSFATAVAWDLHVWWRLWRAEMNDWCF